MVILKEKAKGKKILNKALPQGMVGQGQRWREGYKERLKVIFFVFDLLSSHGYWLQLREGPARTLISDAKLLDHNPRKLLRGGTGASFSPILLNRMWLPYSLMFFPENRPLVCFLKQ